MSKVLFEVTDDNLETGLRGIPVGYCTTSKTDPHEGLSYRDMPVAQMTDRSSEEVMYLLHHGKFETGSKFTEFKNQLQSQGKISNELKKQICSLPREGHPMKLFSTAILLLGMLECTNDYRKDALNLLAKMPHLTATVINHHAGWGETPDPQNDLGYTENFTHMVQCPNKDEAKLLKAFHLFHLLHMDHGGGNLSAFVAKAVCSGNEDIYGSIAGAMCALEGPLHGKANENGLKFVKKVHADVGENASEFEIEGYIQKLLDAKELIYGFGHAVLRVEDPRARIFYHYASANFPTHPLVQTALKLRNAGPAVMTRNPKITNPYPNVDAISGTVLTAAGFEYSQFFTLLFGMSRSTGLTAQIVYDRLIAREGKGTPIVRPKYIYRQSIA